MGMGASPFCPKDSKGSMLQYADKDCSDVNFLVDKANYVKWFSAI